MRLYYIANARIPTEKAHGLTIVKSCEAFAQAGAEVILVVPSRKTQFSEDLYETYGVSKVFTVKYIPTFDALRFSSSRTAFWISYITFYLSAGIYLLFKERRGAVLYTRDVPFLCFRTLGYRVFLECHHIFGRRNAYFSLARRASGIIVISRALKEIFVSAGFPAEKITVESSGVSLEIFGSLISKEEARRELKLPLESPIVLYSGNFTTMGEDKGIRDILLSLKELKDVHFIAVGGSETDRNRYDTEAREVGVAHQVVFFGYASQKTLALYQRAADILLMPFPDKPHYRKHMSPVKMFEYMASGRPIIASDLPTIREVLNENNAVIVPPDNFLSLARAISLLLKNPSKAESLANQARSNVERYTWAQRSNRVLQFIHAHL